MEITIYKIDDDEEIFSSKLITDLEETLRDLEYICMEEEFYGVSVDQHLDISLKETEASGLDGEIIKVNEYSCDLWVKDKIRSTQLWQDQINRLYLDNSKENDLFKNLGVHYNVIIIVNKIYLDDKKPIFAIPFGQAYHDVRKFTVPEFGMNVASRILDKEKINLSNVDVFYKKVLKQMTNYRTGSELPINSSESFDFVQGESKFPETFGKSVKCSFGVSVSKYDLKEYLNKMIEIFYYIDEYEEIMTLPMVEVIRKNDEKNDVLFHEYEKMLISGKSNLSLVSYIMHHDNLIIIDTHVKSIHVKSKKKATSQNIQENNEQSSLDEIILNYIMKNLDSKISDYILVFDFEDNEFETNLTNIISAEVQIDDQEYVLLNGQWCKFNDTYVGLVNSVLDKIEIHYNKNIELRDGQLEIKEGTEDSYFKSFQNVINEIDTDDYKILHKKLIKEKRNGLDFGNGIELCDIYSSKNGGTLISTKKGFSTEESIYLIAQSLLSLKIIEHHDEFNTINVKSFLKPKNIAVQWILPFDKQNNPVKDVINTKKVFDETFKLSNLRSLMLKNKIVEWDSSVRERNMKSIIYLDTPKVS